MKVKQTNLFKLLLVGLTVVTCITVGYATMKGSATANSVFYNVKDYGAKGDGKTLDHQAINRAIDACAKAGGGTVVVPAGTFLCGSIHMKSNINLYLDAGSIILGAEQEMNAYDACEPFEGTAYQDGGHTYFHNSLIWGEKLENISITGPGMINGGGLVSSDGPQDRISGFKYWNRPEEAAKDTTKLPDIQSVRLGNKAIAFKLCSHVVMRDFTIYHGGHFAILATGCNMMTIDNLVIDTNRDGIDIDCCKNVVVSNCLVNSPIDDGICLKSSFALGKNVTTENLTITNCQVSGFEEGTLLDGTMVPLKDGTGRIKLGTEANGGFRNITISNCTFRACRGLALEEVDGGIMENITINNLSMTDVPSYAIYITTGNRKRGPAVNSNSIARNIIISNVVATGVSSKNGIIITGTKEQPIEGLRLENIWLTLKGGGTSEEATIVPEELDKGYPEPWGTSPAYGVFARHVKNLELSNFRLSCDTVDMRPPIVCKDVDGLEIDNFKADLVDGVSPSIFNHVNRLVIRDTPILKGTDQK